MTKNNRWEVLEWETVAKGCIAGRVIDKVTGQPVAGAWVQIRAQTNGQTEDPIFTAWLRLQKMQYGERWELMLVRPDRTLSAADGHYHFVGLPEGATCILTASLPGADCRYKDSEPLKVSIKGMRVFVPTTEGPESEVALFSKDLDLELQPTAIRGTVFVPTTEGPEIVEIRIKECDAHVFSRLSSKDGKKQGEFLLVGLEPWPESTTYSVEFSVKGKIGKTVEVQGLSRGECRDLGKIELILT